MVCHQGSHSGDIPLDLYYFHKGSQKVFAITLISTNKNQMYAAFCYTQLGNNMAYER